METFKNIKTLFFSKNSLYFHIRLFSLIGIMCLALNNVYSVTAEQYPLNRITFINLSTTGLYLNFILGGMLLFMLIGYQYGMTNKIINSDEVTLPKLDSQSFSWLLRTFPIILLWGFYAILFFIISFIIKIHSYIPLAAGICIMPFIKFIFIEFSRNFQFKKNILTPFTF